MQVTGEVKGVGKYKPKFTATGLLLDAGKGEFWADIQGNLDYKKYKGETVTVDIEKNPKGYWGGTLVSGGKSDGGGGDVRGKCLCQVICAGIASSQLQCTDEADVNGWVDMMMGKAQSEPASEPVSEPAAEEDIPF